jgi:DNA-directed RNA polymerase subunit RPC12/RpoP
MGLFSPRGRQKKTQEPNGTVICKKCGKRIAISNPSRIQQDFSAECTACETRKFYKPADLTR